MNHWQLADFEVAAILILNSQSTPQLLRTDWCHRSMRWFSSIEQAARGRKYLQGFGGNTSNELQRPARQLNCIRDSAR